MPFIDFSARQTLVRNSCYPYRQRNKQTERTRERIWFLHRKLEYKTTTFSLCSFLY